MCEHKDLKWHSTQNIRFEHETGRLLHASKMPVKVCSVLIEEAAAIDKYKVHRQKKHL